MTVAGPEVLDLASVSEGLVLDARGVRAVIDSNIADLTSFTVAARDGLTLAEGDSVLLVLQTTAAQCGIYVVGPVTSGSAALTRRIDNASGSKISNGRVVEVSEGTLYAGTSWKAMCTGAKVHGTDDPLYYPRNCRSVVTLAVGTKTLGATQGLWLFSTTKSNIHATVNTPAGMTATVGFSAPVASRTAGKIGTAAAVVNAVKTDSTTDAGNTSTVDVTVHNW